jgi:glutamate/tyrosine decarboxylase-like PLP-dependent enzyme
VVKRVERARTAVFDQLQGLAAGVESAVETGPILPSVTPEQIRSHLARYDFATPMELEEITADVQQMLRTWQVQVTHPRYFGLFNPSVTRASIIADTITAAYNPQLATWRTSPAANEIEHHTLAWLTGKFGLPSDSIATFTSGGAEANLSAVVVALTRAFPEYGEHGLRQLGAAPTIYLSAEAHHSFNKIAHMTGIGRQALRTVGTGRDLKMDVADLARQVAKDRDNGFAPLMVVATAGTTGAGAIDPLQDIARVCRDENLWFHVDAAWGGAAILSPRLRGYLVGIDAADSITCDAHKWFSVPMGAGMFFCRDRESVSAAFHAETSYMPRETEGPVVDPYTHSVQWSRRFIGLKLFVSLAQRGEAGYVEMIEHQAEMGDVLRKLLTEDGWKIVNATPLPVVCFTREGLDPGSFLSALHERQIAWMSEVRLAGCAPVLRACITSFRTTEVDIQFAVREMGQLVTRESGGHLHT